jgi:hypothetical protein
LSGKSVSDLEIEINSLNTLPNAASNQLLLVISVFILQEFHFMISVSGTKRFCHSISRLRQFSSLLRQPRKFRFCWQSQSRSRMATNSSSATHHVTSAPSPKIIGRDTNDPDPHAAPVFSIPPKQDWFKGLIGFGVGLGFTFMYLEWAGYYAHNPQELTEKFSRAAPSEVHFAMQSC